MSASYVDPLERRGVLTVLEREVFGGRAFLTGVVTSDGEVRVLRQIESIDQTPSQWIVDACRAGAKLFYPPLKCVMFNPHSIRPHL